MTDSAFAPKPDSAIDLDFSAEFRITLGTMNLPLP